MFFYLNFIKLRRHPIVALASVLLVAARFSSSAQEPTKAAFYSERQLIPLFPDTGNSGGNTVEATADVMLLGFPRYERHPDFPGNSEGTGRAAIMKRIDGVWTLTTEIEGYFDPDDPYRTGFGLGVALNETATRFVVGAPDEDYQGDVDIGGAWIYEFGPGDSPGNALIAYYSFDDPENPFNDDSGNGRTLEIPVEEEGPTYSASTGLDGSGVFEFGGGLRLIAPIDINVTALPKLTMGAWVKTSSLEPGLRKIIGHDDGGWDRVIGLDNRFGDFRYTSFVGRERPIIGTPAPESVDDWTFIAIAYDEQGSGAGGQSTAEATFYIDLDASTTDDSLQVVTHPTLFNSGASTVAIGGIRPNNTAEGWEGLIDNVFFFAGTLDLETLTAIRDRGVPSVVADPPDIGSSSTVQIRQRLESDVDSYRQFGRLTMASGDIVGVLSDERHGDPGPGFRPTGSVNVYLNKDGDWTQVQKIESKEISADFDTAIMQNGALAIGMPGARVNDVFSLGKVEIFEWNAAIEQFESKATFSPAELTPTNQQLGRDLAFNGDDQIPTTILVAGAPVNEGGRVLIYEKNADTGEWEFAQKLVTPAADYNPEHPWNEFGSSVAISPSGDLIAVQGYLPDGYDGFDTGHLVYLFERVDSTWRFARRLKGSQLQNNNLFGESMTFAGDQLMIGDPSFNAAADNQPDGAIYVFDLSYDEDTVAEQAKKYLYTEYADNSPLFPKDRAAFRYLDSLYASSSSGPVMTPDAAAGEFGADEEERVRLALELVRRGLAENPESATLRNLLLDIYYDWTRILGIQATEEIADVDVVRLDAPSTPGAFIIDQEIAAYARATEANRNAYQTYFGLLNDDLGIESEPPLGFTAFRDEVPSRSLAPPRYLNEDQEETSVTGSDTPVIQAYKDLILLLDLLADQARDAAQLAFLTASNGDTASAIELLGKTDREMFAYASLLEGVFPGLDADRETYPELDTAWAGAEEAFYDLSEMKGRIDGDNNLLGFDPDFLPLLPKPQGQLETVIHTFDLLKERLTSNNETLNPLLRAKNSQAAAVAAWDAYQNNQSDLDAQLSAISGPTSPLRERLIQIQGDGSLPPDQNPATEIYSQIQKIERARNQIKRNQVESANIRQKIQIEVERRAAESGIHDAMARIRVNYANAQADLTEQISYLEGMQKAVGSIADAANPAEFFSSLATGLYVGGVEVAKGQLQAEKDRLAGQEEADIIAQEDLLADVNSRANIRTWLLDMNTLAIDSIDAAIALKQEQGRLAALWQEKERLERRMAAAETALRDRYFADPIHRFRARHQIYVANTDFRHAMETVFFLIKAFEYKWNRDFDIAGWDWNSFFKIRNASELETLVSDLIFAESNITTGIDDSFDWFSFRDDFFGYKDDPEAQYVDPETGELVDSRQAFQSQLKLLLVDGEHMPLPENRDPLDPANRDIDLVIPFSTVREIPGGAFFEKEGYLDKIIALHVRLPGMHSLGRSTVRGTLIYGGTAFIRNKTPGTPDPVRPDKLVDEVTAYSTRVWNAEEGAWSYEDEQTQRITITLDEDERIPPSVLSIDTFNERSVAASNWSLAIEIRDSGIDLVRLDEISDIEIYFHHASATR